MKIFFLSTKLFKSVEDFSFSFIANYSQNKNMESIFLGEYFSFYAEWISMILRIEWNFKLKFTFYPILFYINLPVHRFIAHTHTHKHTIVFRLMHGRLTTRTGRCEKIYIVHTYHWNWTILKNDRNKRNFQFWNRAHPITHIYVWL